MLSWRVVDSVGSELAAIASLLRQPRMLSAALGKSLERELIRHFRDRDREPNAHGWPKQHFWLREVAKQTALTAVSATTATVTIASVPFAHKVLGGDVNAAPGKALSIPLSPEAYKAGSASLFPNELSLVDRSKRGKPPLLIETGVIGKSKAWKIHYILLKTVNHKPDPRAWPLQSVLELRLLATARSVLARVLARRASGRGWAE